MEDKISRNNCKTSDIKANSQSNGFYASETLVQTKDEQIGKDPEIFNPLYLKVLKTMLTARFTDEKMTILAKQNEGGNFHLPSKGHDMVGAVASLFIDPVKDWSLPYYRDRSFVIGLGANLQELFGAFLARKVKNHSGGRMMPEHFCDKELKITCQSSCVASQFLQAVGIAYALKVDKQNSAVYVSSGDGATSQGDFHEALNFACIHKLGVIFAIQDNGWAISVPNKEQIAGGSIAKRSSGYEGLEIFEVDGCGFDELQSAFKQAVSRARNCMGPTLIVAKVARIGAHSSSDDPTKYKDEVLRAYEASRDPLKIFEKKLIDKNILSALEFENLKKEAIETVEVASTNAKKIPFPSVDTVLDHIYKPFELPVSAINTSDIQNEVVMIDAIRNAIDEEMSKDPKILVFGEDVADNKGGVFGATRGLTKKYGHNRCFNTPLAESTILGMAAGMSFVDGFKPVVEIQFSDYFWSGINQLVNEIASIHYRSDGQFNCPVVVRMPSGGYIQGGPYHSQSIEAIVSHIPGLKVVIPSNAEDAKKLLKTAILDPNPVVFLEHKALYRQRLFSARKEPGDNEFLPFGKANIVREGKDITLLCWGIMVPMSVKIADKLKEQCSVEIIDLRTLVPLDMETIKKSIHKTGKVLIVHEAPKTCGFGAELAAKISEEEFFNLDAPIMRLAAKDCMVPYCKDLENAVLPQLEDIEKAILKLYNT